MESTLSRGGVFCRYCGDMKSKEGAGLRYREAGSAAEVADDRTDIITGEGVGLVLPTVTLGSRAVSAFIDYSVYLLIGAAGWLFVSEVWAPANLAQAVTWLTTTIMVWAIGLPFIVQYLTRGFSLGRLVTGTRTVRYDGGSIGMRHALTRAVAGLFDIHLSAGALGAISIFATPRGQRPGDLLAGTIVVKWPRRYKGPEPLLVDHSLAEWARVATIRPLSGRLSIAARDYLRTAKSMTPEKRLARSRDLAAALEAYAAPPPRQGTDPDAFIRTVLALREAADFETARVTMDRQMRTEDRLTALPYSVSSTGGR